MSEDEKKNEGQRCWCCQCWKTIFIAIALLAIGAAIGHIMTMKHHCCNMRGCGEGYGMKACWDRGEREWEGSSECKAVSGKCPPGCTCPMCSKKAACSAEPNKTIKKLATASTEQKRFYSLDGAAKQSFKAGNIEDARKYAMELLALAPKFQGDWNYGNAVQDGNLVLGRIVLHEGRIEEAKQYLLEAGKSPGSPQMNSFGPNMSLARDLLEKGERETVLQYFELCRKFWKMDFGKLDKWSQDVKSGKIPDFGANLVY